jgi:protein SCO1/2
MSMSPSRAIAGLLVIVAAAVAPALAEVPATRPSILDAVTIEQRLNERVPMDLRFTDEIGRPVRLSDCVHDGRPVLLTLVYYQCPMLCSVTLNQLVRSMNALTETAGDGFDVITVSFDPRETPELAAAKKRSYLGAYRRPPADAGWHFLTGDEASIHALAQAVGFHYRWDEQNQVFAHAAALMVLTPDGTISRYFLGVDFPPLELRQALQAASHAEVGRPAEQIFLYCFHYDPATGRYGIVIWRATQALGVITLLALAGFIGGSAARERRRLRRAITEGSG